MCTASQALHDPVHKAPTHNGKTGSIAQFAHMMQDVHQTTRMQPILHTQHTQSNRHTQRAQPTQQTPRNNIKAQTAQSAQDMRTSRMAHRTPRTQRSGLDFRARCHFGERRGGIPQTGHNTYQQYFESQCAVVLQTWAWASLDAWRLEAWGAHLASLACRSHAWFSQSSEVRWGESGA